MPAINHPLDPKKLQQTFTTKTKWLVITGVPSSGKSTLLQDIHIKTGLTYYPEIARTYLEKNTSHCKDETERYHYVRSVLRANEGAFQRALIDNKISLEKDLSPLQVTLFDRGMPDSITYYRNAGLNPNDFLDDCFYRKYALVLMLDPLPLEKDAMRTENENERDFLNIWSMPPEFYGREDHPHKYGYGKLLHSGFHFIDLFAWLSSSNDFLGERAGNKIRITQFTQQPKDFLKQITSKQYEKFFGVDTFNNFFENYKDEEFRGFGETEALSAIQILRDGDVITSGSLNLVDSTVSGRSWFHTPSDVNRENGRMRQARLNVNIGPLMNIQLHNYESYERRFKHEYIQESSAPGNWDHFDMYIFRNDKLIGGKKFEHLRGADFCSTSSDKTKNYAGAMDEAQRISLHEFLSGSEQSTALGDYDRSVLLLSLLHQCSAVERNGGLPYVGADF